MIFQYLLIGHEKDGEIYEDDELTGKITIFPKPVVGSNHNPPVSKFPQYYRVDIHRFNGKRYAVGIARAITGSEIDELIKLSGVSPLPD